MTNMRGTVVVAAAVVSAVAVGGVVLAARDGGAPRPAASASATPGPTAAPTTAAPDTTPPPTVSPTAAPTVTPAPDGVPDTFVGVADERIALFSTATGERLRYLTARTEFGDYGPRFTADRSRIRFTRQTSDCEASLMEMRADGTGLRTLVAPRGSGPMPAEAVTTARGLAYVVYDCAEGTGTLVLRAPGGSTTRLSDGNFMSGPAVSADGRFVYVQASLWEDAPSTHDPTMLRLRRIDVTRRAPDVVVRAQAGCQWEGGVTGSLHRGRPSVASAQRCGDRSSVMVFDERLGDARRLLSLGSFHVMSLGIDPRGRHLLLYRSNWRDDREPDLVQRWSGGDVVTIARDVGDPDW